MCIRSYLENNQKNHRRLNKKCIEKKSLFSVQFCQNFNLKYLTKKCDYMNLKYS